MNGLSVFLLALAVSATVAAQQTGQATMPADIEVRKFAWLPYISRSDWDKDLYRTGTEVAKDERDEREKRRNPTPRPDEVQTMPEVRHQLPENGAKGFQYRLTIRNAGKKTVTAIEWQYIFLNPDDQQEETRHSFVSRQKIKPGDTRELRHFSTTPPTRMLNATSAKGGRPSQSERIEITRIDYSDGSVWKRP